jgi:hypothetical protein
LKFWFEVIETIKLMPCGEEIKVLYYNCPENEEGTTM